ncbi:MAG: ATPase [Bacteroidia bacterium]|nr:ATPase [Bacteroidia bacterium]
MRLIVDAGSTKSHWQITNTRGEVRQVYTDGINLLTHSWGHIETQITEAISQSFDEDIESIEIYAAGGINEESRDTFKRRVSERFGMPVGAITVESDLYLAAKSLCGDKPGVACILGTGSNSCQWDGHKIVKNVKPLGYILGDEGSGAVLGKRLVANWYKGLLSEDIAEKLQEYVGLSYSEVMAKIYKEPGANKYLASMTRFMSANREHRDIQDIIKSAFRDFVERNLMQYDGVEKMQINFVGSIAYYFRGEMEDVLRERGLELGVVKREPLE